MNWIISIASHKWWSVVVLCIRGLVKHKWFSLHTFPHTCISNYLVCNWTQIYHTCIIIFTNVSPSSFFQHSEILFLYIMRSKFKHILYNYLNLSLLYFKIFKEKTEWKCSLEISCNTLPFENGKILESGFFF